jgi:hypothetical protein
MAITKQAKEAQLQQIFRMLLESKTQEEIAHELNIGVRTVQRYTVVIDKRYGQMQAQKTDNTLFTECQLFKTRMLTLYKGLERTVTSLATSGTEKAKCAEVAANIAIDVLKVEAEGIKAVKELGIVTYGKGNRLLHSIQSRYDNADTDRIRDSDDIQQTGESQEQQQSNIPANDNRKF